MFAALALFALFPMISRAETSSEAVYKVPHHNIESDPSEGTGKPGPTAKSNLGPGPKRDTQTPGGSEASEPTTEPQSEGETGEREQSESVPPGKGGNRPPGADGNRAPSAKTGKPDGSERTASTSSKKPAPTSTGTNASQINDSGGSSPVLPILIAVAVLAALSIGVVLYRERRKGDSGDQPHFEGGNG